MRSNPVTAETAAIARDATRLSKQLLVVLTDANEARALLTIRGCDFLAATLADLASGVHDLAQLVERVALRQQAIEAQQIGKALTARAECSRDMDHHD